MATPTSSIDGCISVESYNIPDPIWDLETLSINVNNQGFATLSITILSKATSFTELGLEAMDFTFEVSSNREFSGYIDSIIPQPNNNSDHIAYRVTARGVIC